LPRIFPKLQMISNHSSSSMHIPTTKCERCARGCIGEVRFESITGAIGAHIRRGMIRDKNSINRVRRIERRPQRCRIRPNKIIMLVKKCIEGRHRNNTQDWMEVLTLESFPPPPCTI
jgi:hypothetical protein